METTDILKLQEIYNPKIEALLIELRPLYPIFIDISGEDITRYIFKVASEEEFLTQVVMQLSVDYCPGFMEQLDYFEEHKKEPPPYLYKEILTVLFDTSLVPDKPVIESKNDSFGNEIVSFSWRGKDYTWPYATPNALMLNDSAIYFHFFDLMNNNTDYRWYCYTTEREAIESSYIAYSYVPKILDQMVEKHLPNYVHPITT